MAAKESGGNPIPVFTVADPTLDIRIMDLDSAADVTGRTDPPKVTGSTFRIDSNMYQAFNSFSRPDTTGNTPGFVDIFVKTETGARLNYLYQDNTTAQYLTGQQVNTDPWFWGGAGHQKYWATDLLDRDQYPFYPSGTYTVSAESTLHNMKENYRSGGADYTGKTVTQSYTVTLVPESLNIEANKDSVVRGGHFSVTISGKPDSAYFLWVNGPGTMTGTAGDQPPTILALPWSTRTRMKGHTRSAPTRSSVPGERQFSMMSRHPPRMYLGTSIMQRS